MTNEPVKPGTIVVGVDGSTHSRRALGWAAEQAVLEGRPLTVVHAAGQGAIPTSAWVGFAGAPLEELPDLLAAARAVVDDAVSFVETAMPGLEAIGLPRVGDPRHVLADLSETAHLIVLGSRGRRALASMLLGSVSVSVARHAQCPVVVTRTGRHGVVLDGVLVGADGSPESLPVIEFAFRHASVRRVPLTVMHTSLEVAPGAASQATGEDLRMLLSESVAGLSEKFPDVHVTLQLGFGLVDECLTGGPRPRDLIVVGRHPAHAVTWLLAGSTSSAVLERSDSPVAVVPEAASIN